MSNRWTADQQKVIDGRGKNLLVSAAAGSGKTAVLVERIIKKITAVQQPIDIDRLLIVTFTNAAAAEMRERIGKAITEALQKAPDSVHLQRQETLLHSAQITTIHSFCLHIIRNYFHKINLDPGIRIAEEGEIRLLQGEVADEVLEAAYEKGEPDFLDFVETFATGKQDHQIKELILQLYEFSMSDPWPLKWLDQCILPYQCENVEAFHQTMHGKVFTALLTNLAAAWADQLAQAIMLSEEADGPAAYLELLAEEREAFLELMQAERIEQYYHKINGLTFKRLPVIRKFAGDPDKKAAVMELRNGVKDSLKKLKQRFFYQPPQSMIEQQHRKEAVVGRLIVLTKEFAGAFAAKKLDKNLMDYHDMEHFALKILVDEETKAPTQTALLMRQSYEEIMVDEYQDSNYVQEAILTSVTKEAEGVYNLFMVGDVKQSIYRFRMARPELFMEKYESYAQAGTDKERIDLHKNFRSRQAVIETVNDVFYRIMAKDIGNISYNAATALYRGGEFLEPEGQQVKEQFQTEILIGSLEEDFLEAKEFEAHMIADRIKALIQDQMVYDKAEKSFRKIRYDDIVILLRSVQGYAEQFIQILKDQNIPARASSGTGYFSAIEVQTILNLLRLIDNPRQDIPLTAVLKSPIVNFSGAELAMIRAQYLEAPHFYQAVFAYGRDGENPLLKEKTAQFLLRLSEFRSYVKYKPIHELLYDIMVETGYYSYVYAMPGGSVRQANLQMLLEKAAVFEKTSYRGLFHFIRYMDQLQKYDLDFGEASDEEGENVVRIMSIHKSKGLEFPVVILAAMGKQFNQQDIRGKLLLHPQLGLGMDLIDPIRRIKSPGLVKQIQAAVAKTESWGEELRVLYVAMTRAQDKLILCGAMKKAAERLAALAYTRLTEDGYLSYLKRAGAQSYFDWVLPALSTYPDKYQMRLLGHEDLVIQQVAEVLTADEAYQRLRQEIQEYDPQLYQEIDAKFNYRYPYEKEKEMNLKLSVSELKHRAVELMREEELVSLFEEEETKAYVPAFMRTQEEAEEGNDAALKGTAIHRILECYDFTRPAESFEEQLQQMLTAQRINPALVRLAARNGIEAFLASDLAERMRRAAAKGKLYKEKAFMMGVPALKILPETESGELMLIQGMIDVFFEEEEELVLVDYKTDRVRLETELIKRYQTQIDHYALALAKATGKRVKEKLIFSLSLNKEIRL